jgi:hypothetical protein
MSGQELGGETACLVLPSTALPWEGTSQKVVFRWLLERENDEAD